MADRSALRAAMQAWVDCDCEVCSSDSPVYDHANCAAYREYQHEADAYWDSVDEYETET